MVSSGVGKFGITTSLVVYNTQQGGRKIVPFPRILLDTMTVDEIWVDGCCRKAEPIAMAGIGIYNGVMSRYAPLSAVDDVRKNPPTNQRAELCAYREALSGIIDYINQDLCVTPVCIYSDSVYVVKTVTVWHHNYKVNGWKNSSGNPVANQDLIRLILIKIDMINVFFKAKKMPLLVTKHVKGHSGNQGNERADYLAQRGADEMVRVIKYNLKDANDFKFHEFTEDAPGSETNPYTFQKVVRGHDAESDGDSDESVGMIILSNVRLKPGQTLQEADETDSEDERMFAAALAKMNMEDPHHNYFYVR